MKKRTARSFYRVRLLLLLLLVGAGLVACDSGSPSTPSTSTGPTSPGLGQGQGPTNGTAGPRLNPAPPTLNRKIGYASGGPVAKVDGAPIEADEFNRALDESRASAEEGAGGALDWTTAENVELLKDLRLQTIEGLINYQVVANAAAKENVTASPDEIAARLDDFKKQMSTPENYQDWLARRFLSEEDHKKRLAQLVIFDEMSQRHSPVDEKGEQAHVRHILVKTEDEARQLYSRITAGGNFAALAKQFSLDFESAEKGGDLDWIFHGQTDAPFEAAAFALAPGATSGPIKTDKGFHLIQTLAKEVRPLPFDLVQQRRSEAFAAYIKSLRDKARIEQFLKP